MLGVLKPKLFVFGGAFVVVTLAVLLMLLLVPLHETHHRPALGEVVPVGLVDFAPFPCLWPHGSRLFLGNCSACQPTGSVFHRQDRGSGALLPLLLFPLIEVGRTWFVSCGCSGRRTCQARASTTLAHLSASPKSSTVVSTSCVPSFLSIRSSRTPYWKATMIAWGVIRGMVLRTWLKRCMNRHSVSPSRCLTAWRSHSRPGRAKVP